MAPPGPGSGQITIAWCWPSNCIAATASNLCKEIDTNTELRLISAVLALLKDFLFVSNKNTETTRTCSRGEWGEGKSEQSSDNVYQSLDKQAFAIRDNGQSSLSPVSLVCRDDYAANPFSDLVIQQRSVISGHCCITHRALLRRGEELILHYSNFSGIIIIEWCLCVTSASNNPHPWTLCG